MDTRLQPLLRERHFWASVLVGLPALAYGYTEAFRSIFLGEGFNAVAVTAALTANPITVYLAARQYPRGKSVERAGEGETMPGVDQMVDEVKDDFGTQGAETKAETADAAGEQ